MANYEYVGILKNGRHTNLDLDKTFEAGDEVPLTAADVVAFDNKFSNIRAVEVLDLSVAEKEAAEKEAAEKEAAEKEAAEKEAAEKEAKSKTGKK